MDKIMLIPVFYIFTTWQILVIHADAGNNHQLLFSTNTNISSITTENDAIQTLLQGTGFVQDIDVIVNQKLLFWIEYRQNVIRRGSLREEGRVTEIEDIIQYDSRLLDSFAVDWIYGHIYLIKNAASRIQVTDINGTFIKTFDVFDDIFSNNLVVDPRVGWLFYVRTDRYSVLERMGMDGDLSSRSVIADSRWGPALSAGMSAMSADYSTKRLYWIKWNDMYTNRIHSVDYDGLNLRELLLNEPKVGLPLQSLIVQDTIYWTDDIGKSLRSVNKETGQNFSILIQDLSWTPFALRAMDKRVQPNGINYCHQQNSRCSHICLPKAYRDGVTQRYTCACPDGLQLNPDQRSCTNISK